MPRTIELALELPDAKVKTFNEHYLDDEHYDELVTGEDTDVLKPNGEVLFKLRTNAISLKVCGQAFDALHHAARTGTNNRTSAGGGRRWRLRKDGTQDPHKYAKEGQTNYIGFTERKQQMPFCRSTRFTRQFFNEYKSVLPLARACDSVFKKEMPDRYSAQMEMVKKTDPSWIIPGTSFTTMTSNLNWRTAAHVDKGDYSRGFGVMTVMRQGSYEGGFLVFPKYRIAVDLGTRDVLLADVHDFHGNTPIVGLSRTFSRVSCVLYYRTAMAQCGSPTEEYRQLLDRRKGTSLWG